MITNTKSTNETRHSGFDARCPACLREREAADRDKAADFAVVQHAALGHLNPDAPNAPDAARMLHTVVKLGGPAAGEDFVRRLNAPKAAALRHRFDVYGPEVWSRSTNPAMQEFARQIQWIAAHEAVNPKFDNVTDALAAYREANGPAPR